VAVLYCFLNAEVRSEMTKKWTKSRWHQRNLVLHKEEVEHLLDIARTDHHPQDR